MLPSHSNTLHLTQLSHHAIEQLSPTFESLPKTQHADGQYRLRRYSVISFSEGRLQQLDKQEFMQTDEINRFQGNVVRQFEPILESTLNSAGMRELVELFASANSLPNNQEIEIHQMRISAVYDETQVAPEGVHQDGFNHIALVGIDRSNIVGGEIMLYRSNNEAPFFRKVLEDGEVAMLADDKLWHNAKPIRCIDKERSGHMDVFVLTAKEPGHALHS
jgi:hypothetical protein